MKAAIVPEFIYLNYLMASWLYRRMVSVAIAADVKVELITGDAVYSIACPVLHYKSHFLLVQY
jgi:hypothetical protein